MKRLIAPCLVAAAVLGVLAAPASGEDRPPEEVVRELLPKLLSGDAGEREDATRKILALGEDARAAVERAARGDDPSLSARALELLSDSRWKSTPLEDEEPMRWDRDVARLRKLFENKDFEAWHRRIVKGLPEHIELDLTQLFEDGRLSARTMGRVEESGRLLAWKEDAEGGIRVRVRDGNDADEVVYEASSVEELRRKAPEVAARLDEIRRKHGTARGTVRLRPSDLRVKLASVLKPIRLDEDGVRDYLDRVRASLADSRRAVEALRERLATSKPRLGIEWVRPSRALRAQLGLDTGGMLIRGVTAGTPAGRLGLRKYDVLVELAGRSVATNADVRAALETVPEGETLRAVVIRRAERTELSTRR